MNLDIIKNFFYWTREVNLRKFLDIDLLETTYEEIWIENPDGPKIYAHIHRPKEPGNYPGLIFVPGGGSPGTDYDRGIGVKAEDVASLGFVVLHYDPSGRGMTGGKEDNWGYVHQKELADIIHFFAGVPNVDKDKIGIFSFSIGITITTGALARFPTKIVKYVFDWEGPSNKYIMTKEDTHKPLLNFPTSNDEFWSEREAAQFIGAIECPYFRYQAQVDHVQELSKEHAIELLNHATNGNARWTQCNDNPKNIVYDGKNLEKYNWVPPRLNHKGQILQYLLDIQKDVYV